MQEDERLAKRLAEELNSSSSSSDLEPEMVNVSELPN
jgi:hypothetical protein